MGVNKTGVILKIVCWVLLFIVTVIGWVGHFDSEWKKLWDSDYYNAPGFGGFPYVCKNLDPECPGDAITLEEVFLSFTMIFLILGAVNIIAGFFFSSKFKFIDAGLHALAGLCILISGILILVSAIQIDAYIEKLATSPFPFANAYLKSNVEKAYYGQGSIRKAYRFWEKIAAGVLGILNGVAYFVTAGVLAKSSKE